MRIQHQWKEYEFESDGQYQEFLDYKEANESRKDGDWTIFRDFNELYKEFFKTRGITANDDGGHFSPFKWVKPDTHYTDRITRLAGKRVSKSELRDALEDVGGSLCGFWATEPKGEDETLVRMIKDFEHYNKYKFHASKEHGKSLRQRPFCGGSRCTGRCDKDDPCHEKPAPGLMANFTGARIRRNLAIFHKGIGESLTDAMETKLQEIATYLNIEII